MKRIHFSRIFMAILFTVPLIPLKLDDLGKPVVPAVVGEPVHAGASPAWQIDVVDTAGDVGTHTSITVGVEGWPEISYYDASDQALRYSQLTKTGWISETVSSGNGVGRDTSIKLDSSGVPHISSVDNNSVQYFRKEGAGWQSEMVTSGVILGHTSLDLSDEDQPYLAWCRQNMAAWAAQLEYSHKITTTWPVEIVDGEAEIGKPLPVVGLFASLALDPEGVPHISYYDDYYDDLKYATFDGSDWQSTIVDGDGDVGQYSSLAVDSDGNPHISYYDATNQVLKYTSNQGGSWNPEIVDNSANVGMFSSLAIDRNDIPHISYYDSDSGNLKYAYLDGEMWQTEVVDSDGDVGQYAAIGLDSAGNPYISYYDAVNGDLKVAMHDRFPPKITSGPFVSDITPTSATITWNTDEDSNSVVFYSRIAGKSDLSTLDPSINQSHTISLLGLEPASVYRYVVQSTDPAGNQASSKALFFETSPEPDGIPPTITNLSLSRVDALGDLFQMSAMVSDTSGIARVEFYLDGSLIGTHFASPPPPPPNPAPPQNSGIYGFNLDPAGLGLAREDLFGSHNLEAVAYDRGGLSNAHGAMELLNPEPMNGEVEIEHPENGFIFYIPGDVAPPGSEVETFTIAKQYEWDCSLDTLTLNPSLPSEPQLPSIRYSGLPGSTSPKDPKAVLGGNIPVSETYQPPWCSEVSKAVKEVGFYVDETNLYTSTPSSDQDFDHEYIWDLSGLGTGTHKFSAKAVATDGSWLQRSNFIQILQGEPSIDVLRSVARIDNYFQVSLVVVNNGTVEAAMDELVDHVAGFQPVRKEETNYIVDTDCSPEAIECEVTIDLVDGGYDLFVLGPGESIVVQYLAVPIFYPGTGPIYAIGHEPILVWYQDNTGWVFREFERPGITTEEGEINPITRAQWDSDYLIMTNPFRLRIYNSSEEDVEELLSSLGELAVLKKGLLAYITWTAAGYPHDYRDWIAGWGNQMRGSDGIIGHYLQNGYLLIVGEVEIVESFHIKHDTWWAKARHIDYTDQPYANTSGGWQNPELMVGRIVGNSAAELLIPVRTSINVARGETGYSFDRSHGMTVAGRGHGVRKFENSVDQVTNHLYEEFTSVVVLKKRPLDDAGEDINQLFKYHAPGKDVVYYRDHCNPWNWSGVVSTADFTSTFHVDFVDSNPFAFACCCQAGRYENDSDYSMVEGLFLRGAGVYIGATENSVRDQNNDSCKWFYDDWVGHTHSLAWVFRRLERHNDGFEGNYWDAEYNFYGDPKYDIFLSIPDMASMSDQVQTGAATLEIVIPEYQVTTIEEYDYVEIPGGAVLSELGKPLVPYYRVEYTYPKGEVVQDVVLVSRSGLQTESGLNLQLGVEEWDGSDFSVQAAEEEIWWPDRVFEWEVLDNPDGSSNLVLRIYPFDYDAGTTVSRFFQNYTFDVQTIESSVDITDLAADRNSYQQGDNVDIGLWVENPGEVQDVLVSAVIKDGASGDVVEGLTLHALKDLIGQAYVALGWDSNGYDAGDYYVEVEIIGDNAVLDREMDGFKIGITVAEIASLTAAPTIFDIGDPIIISLRLDNTGSLPISGTTYIEIQDSVGVKVAEFSQGFNDLPVGGSQIFPVSWDSTGFDDGTYRIIGYALYDSKSTSPQAVLVTTERWIFMPIIQK